MANRALAQLEILEDRITQIESSVPPDRLGAANHLAIIAGLKVILEIGKKAALKDENVEVVTMVATLAEVVGHFYNPKPFRSDGTLSREWVDRMRFVSSQLDK